MFCFFMRIYKYIKELQYRFFIIFYSIIINCLTIFSYKEQIAYLLGQHQANLFPYFIATNLTEIFFALFKLSLFLAFYLTYPIIILQLWLFILPGLYRYEYKMMRSFVILTIILFFVSTIITYKIFLPYCWEFFTSFELKAENTLISIHLETRLNEYLDFFIKGFLILNILFHIILAFIIIIKKINLDLLIFYRKIVYLLIFSIATLATPPDIFSQLFIGFLLIFIYECFLITLFILKSYIN